MGNNEEVIGKATTVAKFIQSRNVLSVAFRNAQKNHDYERFVTLPAKTRWYTQHECLCNLIRNEVIIQQLCATKTLMKKYENSDKYEEFVETDKDYSFGDGCGVLISKIRLPLKLIGDVESNKALISQVYMYFQDLLTQYVFSDVEKCVIESRWDFIHTEPMGFAYILNPKTKGGLGMASRYLKKTYAAFTKQISDKDKEGEEFEKELQEFVEFVAEPGMRNHELFNNPSFYPRVWRLVHGRNMFPVLSKLACKVFVIPTSVGLSFPLVDM